MKNVLIVDDHPVVRLAVRILLEKERMTVVGETEDGLEAIQLVKRLSPDLVILDIDILSLNGIDVTQRIRANGFQGGILILSSKNNEHYIRLSIGAGADGFINKRKNLTELHNAMRAIQGGYGYFPLNFMRMESPGQTTKEEGNTITALSAKELDVLRYLAKGIKVVDIAKLMNVSDKTISTYKRRLMTKLKLQNMMDIYEFSRKNNLD